MARRNKSAPIPDPEITPKPEPLTLHQYPWDDFVVECEVGKLICSFVPAGTGPEGFMKPFERRLKEYLGLDVSASFEIKSRKRKHGTDAQHAGVFFLANQAGQKFLLGLPEALIMALSDLLEYSCDYSKIVNTKTPIAKQRADAGLERPGIKVENDEGEVESEVAFPLVRPIELRSAEKKRYEKRLVSRYGVKVGKPLGTTKPDETRLKEQGEFEAQIRQAITIIFKEGTIKQRGIKTAVARNLGIGGFSPKTGNDTSLQAFNQKLKRYRVDFEKLFSECEQDILQNN